MIQYSIQSPQSISSLEAMLKALKVIPRSERSLVPRDSPASPILMEMEYPFLALNSQKHNDLQ
jgi:hypothetical protein